MKAFSQPGCAHLYGLSPVWILHGTREEERGRTSARPLRDQRLNGPPLGAQGGSPGDAGSGQRARLLLAARTTPLKLGSSLLAEGRGLGSQGSSYGHRPSREFRNVR